jgi:2-polyprenyl-6-methoxyphenol hydroxylase-like FAD-dependent oxidoreductase
MSVIIVGAGPTGLMLAGELALAGVPVTVLERRAEQSNLTRAFGIHARTLELLDMRGLAEPLITQGLQVPEIRARLGDTTVRLSLRHPDSRFPYVLIIPQGRTEKMLEERARDLGVRIVRGAEVTGLRQDDTASGSGGARADDDGAGDANGAGDGRGRVTVTLADGRTETADHVVGCDGAHSAVRRLLSVGFSGRSYDTHILLADVRLARELPPSVGAFVGRDGALVLPPFGDGWHRAVIWDRTRQDVPLDRPLEIAEVRASMRGVAGEDFGLEEMRWSTRFLSARRQADRYRVGRVFLAGDAAHIHSPLGALGMNTGIQDAANLAWKLTAAHHGWAPDWLLDSYEEERHPVGRTALRLTDTLQRLAVAPAPVRLLRPYLARGLLGWSPVSDRLRRLVSGLGIAYPTPGSSAAGHRVPDLELTVDGRPTRLHELARTRARNGGRFLFLDAGSDAAAKAERRVAAGPWSGRVEVVAVDPPTAANPTASGPTASGPTAAGPDTAMEASALLVRPDGYVAWSADDPGTREVTAALRHWCGAPA